MRIRDVWQPLASPLAFAFGGATREPAPDFDPLDHVRLHAPTADFHAAAGALMERPLERGRPPWEAHVLPGEDGTSFAVLFKFHHALADGLRALTLAAALMDPMDLPDAPPAPRGAAARGSSRTCASCRDLVRGTLSDVGRALDIGASVARATLGVRSSPALTSSPPAPAAPRASSSTSTTCTASARRVGGTVNDVLIAVVAGRPAPLARRARRRQRGRRAPRPDPRLHGAARAPPTRRATGSPAT